MREEAANLEEKQRSLCLHRIRGWCRTIKGAPVIRAAVMILATLFMFLLGMILFFLWITNATLACGFWVLQLPLDAIMWKMRKNAESQIIPLKDPAVFTKTDYRNACLFSSLSGIMLFSLLLGIAALVGGVNIVGFALVDFIICMVILNSVALFLSLNAMVEADQSFKEFKQNALKSVAPATQLIGENLHWLNSTQPNMPKIIEMMKVEDLARAFELMIGNNLCCVRRNIRELGRTESALFMSGNFYTITPITLIQELVLGVASIPSTCIQKCVEGITPLFSGPAPTVQSLAT